MKNLKVLVGGLCYKVWLVILDEFSREMKEALGRATESYSS